MLKSWATPPASCPEGRHLLRLPQLLFQTETLGDVPDDGEDQPLVGDGHAVPGQPAVAAVLAAVAVDEEHDALALSQPLADVDRRLDVVGVDELEPGPALQLFQLPAQGGGPGWIQLLETAVEAGDAEHVGGQIEEPVAFLLGPLAVGDVPEHELDRGPSAMLEGQPDRLGDDRGAIPADEAFHRQRRRLAGFDHVPRPLHGAGPVLGVDQLGHRPADQLRGVVAAEKPQCRGVGEHHLAVAAHDHAVGQAFQQMPMALLAVAQRLFGALAFRDVDRDVDRGYDPPLLLDGRYIAQQPDRGPVATDVAGLVLDTLAAVEHRIERSAHALCVRDRGVVVDAGADQLGHGASGKRAVQREDAALPVECHDQHRSVLAQHAPASLTGLQRLFGTPALRDVPEHDLARGLTLVGDGPDQDFDVEDLAVQTNEALLGDRSVDLALIGIVYAPHHHRAIVGVDEVEDRLSDHRGERRGAERAQGLGIHEGDLAPDVHGHGHGERVDELPIALLALTQRLRGRRRRLGRRRWRRLRVLFRDENALGRIWHRALPPSSGGPWRSLACAVLRGA